MKILEISEKVGFGGAQEIMRQEHQIFLARGNDLRVLTYDSEFMSSDKDGWINIQPRLNLIRKVVFRFKRNKEFEKALCDVIEAFRPDVIHVHNAFNYFPSLCFILNEYKVEAGKQNPVLILQTLHDSSVICPTSWCINRDGSECCGYKGLKCASCVKSLKDIVRILTLPHEIRLRRRTFDHLLSPSKWLAEKCGIQGLDVEVVRNSITSSMKTVVLPTKKERSILFLGGISEGKGVTSLIQAWEKVLSNLGDDWAKLRIAGPIEDSYSQKFKQLCSSAPSIEYLDELSRCDALNEISRNWAVIVPSLWLENYPTVALEAVSQRTLVLGANRGGVPEIVGSSDYLFNPCDVDEIACSILKAFSLSSSEYEEAVNQQTGYTKLSITEDAYYTALNDIILACSKQD